MGPALHADSSACLVEINATVTGSRLAGSTHLKAGSHGRRQAEVLSWVGLHAEQM